MITTKEKLKNSESGTEKIKNGSMKTYCKNMMSGTNIPTNIRANKITYLEFEKTSFRVSFSILVHHVHNIYWIKL